MDTNDSLWWIQMIAPVNTSNNLSKIFICPRHSSRRRCQTFWWNTPLSKVSTVKWVADLCTGRSGTICCALIRARTFGVIRATVSIVLSHPLLHAVFADIIPNPLSREAFGFIVLVLVATFGAFVFWVKEINKQLDESALDYLSCQSFFEGKPTDFACRHVVTEETTCPHCL